MLKTDAKKLETRDFISVGIFSLIYAVVAFVIGGADGISKEVLANADMKWSLSNLTLPHPLVRVLLMEQLYRAMTIIHHHPYHRGDYF